MAEHMRAMEWQEDAVHERTYEVHDPLSLESLGEVPEAVRAAWEALIVARPNQPGLLRRDVVGHCVAMHVQLDRKALSTHIPGLLRLADALALPRRPVEAWLDSLPLGTELTVVSLGRDGPLQMNVYVAPRQSGFTQPGPEPSDLRRAPGSVLWQLRLRDGEDTPAWLLFALPDAKLRYRCAAASAGVQVWNGSSVPDGAGLARRLAAVVQPDASTLADRLNLAGPALRAALHDAGLEVTGIHQNTEAEMVPVISQPPVKVLTGDR